MADRVVHSFEADGLVYFVWDSGYLVGFNPQTQEWNKLRVAHPSEIAEPTLSRELAQPAPLAPDIFLRPRDVAARTGYSVATLARWRCHGEGPPYRKVGGRTVVYLWRDVLEWFGNAPEVSNG